MQGYQAMQGTQRTKLDVLFVTPDTALRAHQSDSPNFPAMHIVAESLHLI